jgi:hypothetical protein
MTTIELTDEETNFLMNIMLILQDKRFYDRIDYEADVCHLLLWKNEIDFDMFKNIEDKLYNKSEIK